MDEIENAIESLHKLGFTANKLYTACYVALFHIEHPDEFTKEVAKRLLKTSLVDAAATGYIDVSGITETVKKIFEGGGGDENKKENTN